MVKGESRIVVARARRVNQNDSPSIVSLWDLSLSRPRAKKERMHNLLRDVDSKMSLCRHLDFPPSLLFHLEIMLWGYIMKRQVVS